MVDAPIVESDRPRDVLLVRHGQTDWNVERRMQGWRPVPLNDTGREQIRASGRWLRASLASDAQLGLWSSPILRAEQSAALLHEVLEGHVGALKRHDGLREFDMGSWTGERRRDLMREPLWRAYLEDPTDVRFPDGEAIVEIQQRGVAAVNEILAEEAADCVVLVSHGGLICLVVMALMRLPLSNYHRLGIENASITHARVEPGGRCRFFGVNKTPTLRVPG